MGWIVVALSLCISVKQASAWGQVIDTGEGCTVVSRRNGVVIEHVVQVDLFDVGQHLGCHRLNHVNGRGATGRTALTAVRKFFVGRLVVENAEADLLHVVGAGAAAGRLTSRLDGGEEEADERADDGDDDQQLDERERGGERRSRRMTNHGDRKSVV